MRYLDLDNDLVQWKTALADGYPIVFALATFETFAQCAAKHRFGVVPMPDPDSTTTDTVRASHTFVAVGYSGETSPLMRATYKRSPNLLSNRSPDADSVFIARNSWGPKWADNGYCYFPYNYVLTPNLGAIDAWVLQTREGIEDFRKSWVKLSGKGKKKVNAKAVNNNWRKDGPAAKQKYSFLNKGNGVHFEINPFHPDDYDQFTDPAWVVAEDYNEERPEQYARLVKKFGTDDDGAGYDDYGNDDEEEEGSEEEDVEEEESEEEESEKEEEEGAFERDAQALRYLSAALLAQSVL
jgi:hypothetical protein